MGSHAPFRGWLSGPIGSLGLNALAQAAMEFMDMVAHPSSLVAEGELLLAAGRTAPQPEGSQHRRVEGGDAVRTLHPGRPSISHVSFGFDDDLLREKHDDVLFEGV